MPPYIKKTFLNFFSFFLLAFSLYIFISLVSYDSSDSGFFSKNSSEIINNLGGPLGATVSDFLFTLFGYGSYLFLLIGSVWAIQTLFYEDKYPSNIKTAIRFFSSIFLLICFCSVGYFYFLENFSGFIGKEIFLSISSIFGDIGSLIFLIILLIPTLSLSFNFSWLNFIDQIGKILIILVNFLSNIVLKIYELLKRSLFDIFSKSKKIIVSLQGNLDKKIKSKPEISKAVSYTHLRAHET